MKIVKQRLNLQFEWCEVCQNLILISICEFTAGGHDYLPERHCKHVSVVCLNPNCTCDLDRFDSYGSNVTYEDIKFVNWALRDLYANQMDRLRERINFKKITDSQALAMIRESSDKDSCLAQIDAVNASIKRKLSRVKAKKELCKRVSMWMLRKITREKFEEKTNG